MNRFFIPRENVNQQEKTLLIEGEDVKHIAKVLRLKAGDTIEVCDGQWDYLGTIQRVSKDEVIAQYEAPLPLNQEPPITVRLYQGLPKGPKMELIIQKTTEMGISEIIPVITKRAVVQLKESKDGEKKQERWQKIAIEAAKQSKRGKIPTVLLPMEYAQALTHGKDNDLNIMAYELEQTQGLKPLLEANAGKVKSIGIWIGPEGGYEAAEVTAGIESGIVPVTLGPRILRTETAGLSLLSMIMYELGDLGGK